MPKLCPKIILEGTRLTHKTDLAFALNEHPRVVGERKYRYHSPVVSGEWCGFTNEPWGRGLINFAPGELDRAIATYDAWLTLIELLPYYSWIIDRFHVSTLAWQRAQGALDAASMQRLERALERTQARLARLGFVVVVCVREPGTFERARAERLLVSGRPGQYDDLSAFVAEQDRIRRIAAAGVLPVLEVDVSDDDVHGAADRVAAWLRETDRLEAPAGL